jgi:hypothetical protein
VPAVGVHSTAIACGMILDEVGIGIEVLLIIFIVRLRCLLGGNGLVVERRGRRRRGKKVESI